MTVRGIPCVVCGWIETAHQFPDDYRMCDHKYVPERHLRGLTDDRDGQGDSYSTPENA
jgi:hypothetical protein